MTAVRISKDVLWSTVWNGPWPDGGPIHRTVVSPTSSSNSRFRARRRVSSRIRVSRSPAISLNRSLNISSAPLRSKVISRGINPSPNPKRSRSISNLPRLLHLNRSISSPPLPVIRRRVASLLKICRSLASSNPMGWPQTTPVFSHYSQ